MIEMIFAAGFIAVGLALGIYGIRGIVHKRIVVFRPGPTAKLVEGQKAVSNGFVVATLGFGFSFLGAILLFASVHGN